MRKAPVSEKGGMRVRTYAVLQRAVEEGVTAGNRRAYKHTDTPSPEAVEEHITREVLNSICEWFSFDQEP
jgi:hypothetical protein